MENESRVRALELAVGSGATSAEMVDLAQDFYDFLVPSIVSVDVAVGTAPVATPVTRKRRTAAVDPTSATTPAAQPAPIVAAPTAPVAPVILAVAPVANGNATVKQVANAIEALAIAKGRDAALGVLKGFEVERVSMLKPEQLTQALANAQLALAAQANPAASVGSLI